MNIKNVFILALLFLSVTSCRMLNAGMVKNHGHGHHSDATHDVQPPPPTAHPVNVGYEYYYYPDSYVYYNSYNRTYFYLSGTHWQSGTQLPHDIQLNDHRVIVSLESNKPYSRHQHHKNKYPRNHKEKHGNSHHKKKANKHKNKHKKKHSKSQSSNKHDNDDGYKRIIVP